MPALPTPIRDAAYIAIGFGVLAFQRAQVQRVELQKGLGGLGETLEDRLMLVEERLEGLTDQVEQVLDTVEERLPEQAREVLSSAREAAKEAGEQLNKLVRPLRDAA